MQDASPNTSGECVSKGKYSGSLYTEVSSQVWEKGKLTLMEWGTALRAPQHHLHYVPCDTQTTPWTYLAKSNSFLSSTSLPVSLLGSKEFYLWAQPSWASGPINSQFCSGLAAVCNCTFLLLNYGTRILQARDEKHLITEKQNKPGQLTSVVRPC